MGFIKRLCTQTYGIGCIKASYQILKNLTVFKSHSTYNEISGIRERVQGLKQLLCMQPTGFDPWHHKWPWVLPGVNEWPLSTEAVPGYPQEWPQVQNNKKERKGKFS